MEHKIIKTILISRVTELISNKYKMSIDDARDNLYSSPLIDLIDDDDTGLYGESPLYVFSIYEQMIKKEANKI